MADRDSAPLFAPGQLLDDWFLIVRFLGRGGMGEVYEAENRKTGETVALKTSFARDHDASQRFMREIRLALRVTHPNVCRIHDVFHHSGETDGGETREIPFFTMEMLAGETLEQRLRRQGRMSSIEAGPIVRQIVEGLAAAHKAGVVHRDFKTSNVMLVPEPEGVRAVITDFGLALASADREADGGRLTVRGAIFGTPEYMAPEQVRGGETTTATDIYALGVVIYEMVTGELPLHEPPPEPRLYVSDLDPVWNDAILRCLELKPADRFKDVRDIAAALGVGPAPSRKPLAKWRWLLAAACLALAILLSVPWIPSPAEKVSKERPAVAVLGFRSSTGPAGTDSINKILVAALPTELKAGGKLRLIPGEAVARLGLADTESFSPETLQKIRRNVGADLVVFGSYISRAGQPVPERLDVSVQDAATGKKVASVADTNGGSIADLISRLGERLRRELGVGELSSDEQREVRAALPGAAAGLYARGLARLWGASAPKTLSVIDAQEARKLFEEAVKAEPEYPLAHLELAKVLKRLGYVREAENAAERAFKRSRPLPEEEELRVEAQYRAIAGEWDEATEIYNRLRASFPDDLEYGLRLAEAQTKAGNGEEALATIESLRKRSVPEGDDSRLDLAAAAAAASQQDFDRQLKLAGTAEQKGRSLTDFGLVAQALLEQGSAHFSKGEYQEALEALGATQKIYDEAGDRLAVARTIGDKGDIYASQGDEEAALQQYQVALEESRKLGDRPGQALQLNRIAIVFSTQGKKQAALDIWEEAVRISDELGDEMGTVAPRNNMAIVYAEQGNLTAARTQYERVLNAYGSTHYRDGKATAMGNLADVLHSQGELKKAGDLFKDALDIAGKPPHEPRDYLLNDMGRLLATKGDKIQAWEKLEESLELRQKQSRTVVAESELAMAGFLADKGDFEGARTLADLALTNFSESQPIEKAKARAVLARALAALGDVDEARKQIDESQNLASKIESPELHMIVDLAAGQVCAASGEVQKARDLFEKVRTQALRRNFVVLQLEAQLQRGKLETERGDRADGRARLAELQNIAQRRGFGRIARDARELQGIRGLLP